MGSVTNVPDHGGPSSAAVIAPGTPIGNLGRGTGDFTSLSATGLVALTGSYGDQLTLGALNNGGLVEFVRGSDGTVVGTMGMFNATSGSMIIETTAASSAVVIYLNRTPSGRGEVFRVSHLNDGCASVSVAVPSARFHLPAGAAAAGGAPFKLTAGTNLTTVENGAMEFDGTNLFFTAAGVRRTINWT